VEIRQEEEEVYKMSEMGENQGRSETYITLF
jgi:hypothetical protein